jgi:hypothetical protein
MTLRISIGADPSATRKFILRSCSNLLLFTGIAKSYSDLCGFRGAYMDPSRAQELRKVDVFDRDACIYPALNY